MPLPRPGLYPFWFWNGIQTEPEISRQMALFQASGYRGVVLHSRTGNQIPYLFDRWFELIRHACLEAKRLGLKAWLYDEDGYPSGNAGMRIQKDRPDLIQKSLLYAYEGTDPAAPAFAAYDPETYRLLDEHAVPAGTPALRFRIAEHPRHVDTLHPETCRLFLEWTHERYLAAVGDLFGDVLEAVYTDDESYLVWAGSGLVYSPALETEYRDRLHPATSARRTTTAPQATRTAPSAASRASSRTSTPAPSPASSSRTASSPPRRSPSPVGRRPRRSRTRRCSSSSPWA